MRNLRLGSSLVFAGLWILIVTCLVTPARSAAIPLVPAAPTSQPATATGSSQDTMLDAFARTRLFQLAEGKQTTSLQEMLRPEFWIDTIKELVVAAVSFIPRLLASLLFLAVFWAIYRALRRMVMSAMTSAHVDPSIRDMLIAVVKWTVMGFGLVIACNQVGIPIVAMLTGVSILGLAVGFAAQETLANFIAGVVIFWDKPFKVGDWLTIETTFGQVQRITFRSCRLLTTGGEIAIFPNTYMLSHRVANHTAHPLSRVNISLPLAATRNIESARQCLLAITRGDHRIVAHPAPDVVVADCTDATTILLLRFWIQDPATEHRIAYEYREKAKLALEPDTVPPMPLAA